EDGTAAIGGLQMGIVTMRETPQDETRTAARTPPGVAGQNGAERPKPHGGRLALAYVAMVGAGVLLFLLIRSWGEGLTAPMPAAGAEIGRAAARAQPNILAQILLGLLAILLASRAVGAFFRYFGQPPVIGEVLAGILLGPSLLGRIAPAAMAFLF